MYIRDNLTCYGYYWLQHFGHSMLLILLYYNHTGTILFAVVRAINTHPGESLFVRIILSLNIMYYHSILVIVL